jgi:hypothetical protein
MAPSQARQRQQQATQSALERMAVAYGLPVEAAAPRQPAYTPNYQNPDAVTAALEGILGGTASAATPSVTAAVTEAVVTPASLHNLRQRPQTRATVAITEARATRVRGQGQNEGGGEMQGQNEGGGEMQQPTTDNNSFGLGIEVGNADEGPPQPNAAPPAQARQSPARMYSTTS